MSWNGKSQNRKTKLKTCDLSDRWIIVGIMNDLCFVIDGNLEKFAKVFEVLKTNKMILVVRCIPVEEKEA